MALRVAYIGEEISGLGFRLAGADVYAADANPAAVRQALQRARDHADMVLLEAGLSELVREELKQLIAEEPVPPVLVVPGIVSDQVFTIGGLLEARHLLGIA